MVKSRIKIRVILFVLFSLMAILLVIYNETQNEGTDSKSELATIYASDSSTITEGKALFESYCASCHSVDEEGIGPRLGGITSIISELDLIKYIQNPSVVITSGNLRAKYLLNKYKIPMPQTFLKEVQISNILAYINQQSDYLGIDPLEVDLNNPLIAKERLVPPVRKSGLSIELEDYFQLPRGADRPPDKGLATLRAHPSGDGTLFVSDQMGIIYSVNNSKVVSYLNVKKEVEDFIFKPGIGTGLGSFALHPGFLENGLIYTTHAVEYLGKPAINDGAFPDTIGVGLQWVLSEWKLKEIGSPIFEGTTREVLRINTPTTAHGIQDIGFSPGQDKNDANYGMLYIGIGDGGSNNIKLPELCHDIRSLLGTIIRIDPTGNSSSTGKYGIPSDNPFIENTDPKERKEIWAYGFRNPHRMCWDMTNGKRMIVADVGEANIEEVNIVEKGGDYGWSVLEGNNGISTKIDKTVVYKVGADVLASYKAPFGQYDHSDGNAISGGFVYRGPIRELSNKYIFGDIVTGRLFYMNIDEALSDSTVYDLSIVKNGIETGLKKIVDTKRVHLRIGYDQYSGQLFIMTKDDAMIRKVSKAFYQESHIQ